ncbi:class IV adenylate cyclase [Methanobacterium alkalithermotolerans]|uniref:Class IV adenylate cyclase n=1 Tax=Methanobacterium alkalithermotolerans TaxID=2731220 RepID=A0A8T8K4X8_9EURY|nr:class IV adenylate cyclase [Methanobacterium alkalithermotolerans]QUH23626.1 class IV adenylate cyclase [Methanobacterium alkalithermotolerans]RJS49817.1 MAG: adenylate cyclase [Methanobacterium sp.]
MLEVEVKARIDDFEGIRKKLISMGAKNKGIQRQDDTYFNAPHRDFAKTDEALRIRKIPSDDGMKVYMTYKGSKMDDLSKTRLEVEVMVEDSIKTAKIFECLGFKGEKKVTKDREVYHLKDMIISLDTIHNLGQFIEIEKEIPEGDDYEKVRDEIFQIYEKLGVSEGFERKSYLELLDL